MTKEQILELATIQSNIISLEKAVENVKWGKDHINSHNVSINIPTSTISVDLIPEFGQEIVNLLLDRLIEELKIQTERRNNLVLCTMESKTTYKKIDKI